MPLETAAHISGLVASNPAHSDGLNQADSHLRLIKQVLLTDVGSSLTNQSLTVVDGTATAPSIGFAADATAGLYRKGTGQMAVVGSLTGQGAVPIGAFIDFAGQTAPAGYLPCDGQAVSRTTYADLYAALGGAGSPWGQGDGTTTFNVPNLLTRYRRHRDNSTVSGSIGNLQAQDVQPHLHSVVGNTGGHSADHTHPVIGNTGAMSANSIHTHGISNSTTLIQSGSGSGIGGGGSFGTTVAPSSAFSINNANIDHTHSVNFTSGVSSNDHTHAINLNTSSVGNTETRPVSATVLVCIRAL